MGGIGSGMWSRRDKKTTIEECRRLEVLILHRKNALNFGCSGTITWKRNDRPWGEIRIEVETTSLDLVYHYTGYGGSQDVKERVPLAWTSCNYGGERPWFLCPGCGRRVGVLFLGGSYFPCRHCYHLSYSSQNKNTVLDKVCRRRDKLCERLGEKWWRKPKGMHQKTFDRLRRRLSYAEMQAYVLLDRAMEKLSSMGLL
ncbi:MAG: hypothetical protein ABSF52_19185 [Syntrophobacteraceae bacterium]|jgi:hypothetical protein